MDFIVWSHKVTLDRLTIWSKLKNSSLQTNQLYALQITSQFYTLIPSDLSIVIMFKLTETVVLLKSCTNVA